MEIIMDDWESTKTLQSIQQDIVINKPCKNSNYEHYHQWA